MAGEQIGGEPAFYGEVGENQALSSPQSYIDFLDNGCSYFMLFGMTYEQYWHGDVCMAKHFYCSYELKKEIEAEESNRDAWLHGLYALNANEVMIEKITRSFSGKKGKLKSKYPEKPFDFMEQAREKKKQEQMTKKEKEQAEADKWLKLFFGQ